MTLIKNYSGKGRIPGHSTDLEFGLKGVRCIATELIGKKHVRIKSTRSRAEYIVPISKWKACPTVKV